MGQDALPPSPLPPSPLPRPLSDADGGCRCRSLCASLRSFASLRFMPRSASRIIVHIRVRILDTLTALLLSLSECKIILPAKSIRDMTTVWSEFLLCGVLRCLLLPVLCGLVRWSCAVVIALLFHGFWVCGSGSGTSCARY